MGERGPPPKPTALKLAGGNPGGRPLNADEPVPPAGEPDPPTWLGERGREIWDQLVPRMAKIGLARSIDGAALARYCVLLVQFSDAALFVEQNGLTYAFPLQQPDSGDGKKGKRRSRPAVSGFRAFPQVKLMNDLNNALVKLEREFGLTPSARTRIRVTAEKDAGSDADKLKHKFFG
jgi:P27 family predicted phage terminase small subunit